jgi:hypothetical protein
MARVSRWHRILGRGSEQQAGKAERIKTAAICFTPPTGKIIR